MERAMGRRLKRSEIVHHRNENRVDNAPSNLAVMTSKEHADEHMRLWVKKALELHENGKSNAEIARALGKSTLHIWRALATRGLKGNRLNSRIIKWDVDEATRLLKSGNTLRGVGRALGVSHNVISHRLKQLGMI